MSNKSPKLKISFITNDIINKNIEKQLVNIIAESIYENESFQKSLQSAINPAN